MEFLRKGWITTQKIDSLIVECFNDKQGYEDTPTLSYFWVKWTMGSIPLISIFFPEGEKKSPLPQETSELNWG